SISAPQSIPSAGSVTTSGSTTMSQIHGVYGLVPSGAFSSAGGYGYVTGFSSSLAPKSLQRGDRTAGGATREQAPAQEGAFQRAVTVDAAGTEAAGLTHRVQAGDRGSGRVEYLSIQVRLDSAEALAREDVQFDGDQRARFRVEHLVRARYPDQLVSAVVARL